MEKIRRKTVFEKRLLQTRDEVRSLLVSLDKDGVEGLGSHLIVMTKTYKKGKLNQILEDLILCLKDLSGKNTGCCTEGINLSIATRRDAVAFLERIRRDFI